MTATVDFLPIAASGGANVESQGSFAGSGHQLNGFTGGIALSMQLNKCWRQASIMAAAIANMIALSTGESVLDDGNLQALIQLVALGIASTQFCGTTGGSANAQTLTPPIPVTAYIAGATYRATAGFTNTGATTLNISALGAVAIRKRTATGLVALTGKEIFVNEIFEVTYDGTFFQLASEPAGGSDSLPTITFQPGTNGGDYSSASSSFVNVDGTNLAYTVVVPVGWKLIIQACGMISAPAIATSVTTDVCIADGGSPLNIITMQDSNGDPSQNSFCLQWVINGDGASHAITLQYKKDGGSASNAIIVNSSGNVPTMIFTLTPSN